jgi:hypothetical protein
MTAKEKEDVEKLLKKLYKILQTVYEKYPDNQILIDRILDDINLARKLLKL